MDSEFCKESKVVSILMVVYNAPEYTRESIETVCSMTKGVDYELVVVDNASGNETKELLQKLKSEGKIDRLYFNDTNSFFAGGNNIASKIADKNSTHYLLLNSDVSIKDENWLKKILSFSQENNCAVVSYGAVLYCPERADGYCLLIEKKLYDHYMLDENFAFFWGLTKLESQILAEKRNIVAFRNHEKYIHHYGGGSGDAYKKAKGMDTNISEVMHWFDGKRMVQVFYSIDSCGFINKLYDLYVHSFICKFLIRIESVFFNRLKRIMAK